MFATVHSAHSVHIFPRVYVSDSGPSSTGDACTVTRLAGTVDVHVSTFLLAQQSRSETTYHPEQRENSSGPLVAVTTVVPTPTLTVCGPPSHHSILPRSTVTTGVHLGCKSYHLHACRLSCSTTKQQDFQERSLGTQQHLGDPQQTACLTIGAFASITGPQDRELIRLVPQLLK